MNNEAHHQIGAGLTAVNAMDPAIFTSGTWREVSQQITKHLPFDYRHVTEIYNCWFWSEVVFILFNKKKRALQDFIAGTVVVQKKRRITYNGQSEADRLNIHEGEDRPRKGRK